MNACAFAARAAASTSRRRVAIRRSVRDVRAHGVVEQDRVLAHDSRERAERGERDLARIDAVERDQAVRRFNEARNEIDQRALPRPARADERDHVAAARGEGDVVEHRLVAVRERDAVELDRTAQRAHRSRALVALFFGGLVEDLEQAFRRRERLLRDRRGLRELLERRQQAHDEDHERHEHAGIERLREHFARADAEHADGDDRRRVLP